MLSSMMPPVFRELESSRHVLLAGAGGGFDVFSALPFYFALRDAGKQVALANLTFSSMGSFAGEQISEACWKITADSEGSERYFPEKHLAAFLANEGTPTPIYALDRTGCKPVMEAYQTLLKRLEFDTLLLVDGGTDSLMRGDEQELGTPEEDIVSIAATCQLPIKRKLFACLGFGVDSYHGVAHDFVLEAVAALSREGGYLGAFALTPDMPVVHQYRRALEYVLERTPGYESIVCTSIMAAIEGHFDNFHSVERTRGSKLYINPLMSIYWCFHLEAVARRNLYLDQILQTNSYSDVSRAITQFRIGEVPIRQKRVIPM
jgi:hypothetical protein